MKRLMAALAVALALSASASAATLPEGPALVQTMEKVDAEFFALFFQGCDPDRLTRSLSPDFEMYHDKGGEVARSAVPFVAEYKKACEARKAPDAWRSRRELVPGTMSLHPIAGIGVVQQGEHIFYEQKGDGPERLAGRSRFTQLWRLEPDGWKLSRVFSYDHEVMK